MCSSRPVAAGTLPPLTGLVAALYPFPSFKFGYSLTAAALTWPFDQAWFERSIPRMGATNLVLGAAVLLLIFLTLQTLSGNLVVPAAACVFYIFRQTAVMVAFLPCALWNARSALMSMSETPSP